MKKMLKITGMILMVTFGFVSLCFGQEEPTSVKKFQSALLNKYADLKYVITDLPFAVEADNSLDFYLSDLMILQRADSLLSDTSKWNRNDDRACSDDIANGKYSLFCALYKSSVDITGEYLHRRTVMQQIRFIIGRYYRDRFTNHRLMDFNNNPVTTLEDVKEVIAKSEAVIRKQLEEKEEVLVIIHKLFGYINHHEMNAAQNLFSKKAVWYRLDNKNDTIASGYGMQLLPPGTGSRQIREKTGGTSFVKVGQNLGMVSVPYQLWDKEKLLYAGTHLFTLIRSKKGWQITSVNDGANTDDK